MNLKLRKISKFKIVMSVVMCFVLFFCFCSKLYFVQAADSALDDNALTKLHLTSMMTKSGYLSYYPGNIDWNTRYNCTEGNEPLFFKSETWKKFALEVTGSSEPDFNSSFDLYMINICVSDNFGPEEYGLVVPKGARVCAAVSSCDDSNGRFYNSDSIDGQTKRPLFLTDSKRAIFFNIMKMVVLF